MSTGTYYEDLAAHHLQAAGLNILQRNFRCKLGEIDLICRHGHTLVFVEVRYRANPRYASALQSITPAKQRKLIRAAQVYLKRAQRGQDCACRFDVVAISPGKSDPCAQVHWLQSAFTL